MAVSRRRVLRILLALSVVGGLAVAIGLGVALASLSGGPSLAGYSVLDVVMTALPFLAVVVVLTVCVGSFGARVRFAIGGLALASGIVAGAGLGLAALGSTLSRIEPQHQPPALNSLLLAVWGVGGQLAPVAVVLAVGALLLTVSTGVTRHVVAARAAHVVAPAV